MKLSDRPVDNLEDHSVIEGEAMERGANEFRQNSQDSSIETLEGTFGTYKKMIEEVEDYAIIFLDREGVIQNWNRGAEKIKGYKEEEIVGRSFKNFYSEEDRVSGLPDMLLREAATKGKAAHEGWRIRKDGSKFWGSILITAIHDQDDHVIGFTKVTRDLSERKSADDQLRKYASDLEKKNKELEQFTYIVSHDFREPLRKIIMFSSMILHSDTEHLSASTNEKLQKINKAANRLNTSMEDLLSLIQMNPEERLKEVDLNDIVKEVSEDLELLIQQKKASITTTALPVVKAIPTQIHELFYNIFSNALKFTRNDTHPKINISTQEVQARTLGLAETIPPEKMYYDIRIQDNGIGFSPQHHDKIFTMFQRLHAEKDFKGSGVGLAICKKIVTNHEGYIYAESKPGSGSTFHIVLPQVLKVNKEDVAAV